MRQHASTRTGSSCHPVKRALALALLCALALAGAAGTAGARGPTISDIQPYDTIFVHEQGLDLTGLRNATTNNPVTSLRKYADDRPDRALVNDIPVADDRNFELLAFEVGEYTGSYYAFNPTDGITHQILIKEPSLQLDVVLADPYHADSVEGFSISRNTRLAFQITAPDVGSFYRAGNTYPATIDLLITSPGDSQSTVIAGRDMSGLNVTSTRFYTDDPGMPGPVVLADLKEGAYSIQAQWSAPQGFADYASKSNAVTFTVGSRMDVGTPTPTAGPTAQPATPVPTTPAATAEPMTPPTTAPPETPVETTVPATAAPSPTATQTPLSVAAVLGAVAITLAVLRKRP